MKVPLVIYGFALIERDARFHNRLKIVFRKECRFDPDHRYLLQLIISNLNVNITVILTVSHSCGERFFCVHLIVNLGSILNVGVKNFIK
jgi:hypothetical protein